MEEAIRTKIVDRLADRYAGSFDRDEIDQLVTDSAEQLGRTSKAPQFLPILVERFAGGRLELLAHDRGLTAGAVPDVLFVCNGNAGRSQMAAAFLNARAQGRLRGWSAGVNPLGEVLPDVVAAMQEKGIDLDEAFAKPVTRDITAAVDYVVAIGVSDEDLPQHGKHQVDWAVPPVVGTDLDHVRRTRDDIEQRVLRLVDDLLG